MHASTLELEEYVSGLLEPSRAFELDAHLEACVECARALVREAKLEVALRSIAGELRCGRTVHPERSVVEDDAESNGCGEWAGSAEDRDSGILESPPTATSASLGILRPFDALRGEPGAQDKHVSWGGFSRAIGFGAIAAAVLAFTVTHLPKAPAVAPAPAVLVADAGDLAATHRAPDARAGGVVFGDAVSGGTP